MRRKGKLARVARVMSGVGPRHVGRWPGSPPSRPRVTVSRRHGGEAEWVGESPARGTYQGRASVLVKKEGVFHSPRIAISLLVKIFRFYERGFFTTSQTAW